MPLHTAATPPDSASGPAAPALDLGPLSWVLDELRLSLDSVVATVRGFVRDNEHSRQTDLSVVDASPLRLARQQLHQAVGALEMCGLEEAAPVLHALEAAVQHLVQRPDLAQDSAAVAVQQAAHALIDYLERLLRQRPVPALRLFPAYEAVQRLAGAQKTHPADLWAFRPHALPEPPAGPALAIGTAVRAQFDASVLKVVKSLDAPAAAALARLCGGLARGASAPMERHVWMAAAGYFDAVAAHALPDDLYVKRAASRVLMQYSQLAQGQHQGLDALLHDLLFFCAIAQPAPGAAAPHWQAVAQCHGFGALAGLRYADPVLGRFDPAQLQALRQRVQTASERWSELTAGDRSRRPDAAEALAVVGRALPALLPAAGPLAEALAACADGVAHDHRLPAAAMALEMATALLFLEALLADFDPDAAQQPQRMYTLAQRLLNALRGEPSHPLQPWMESLYHQVSERRSLGTVVAEIQATLTEVEPALDAFFRASTNAALRDALRPVPDRLLQVRSVLSVLGLPEAEHAVNAMRLRLEDMLADRSATPSGAAPHTDWPHEAATLADNFSALGLVLDMLGYQPDLARTQFRFDAASGRLQATGLTAPAPVAPVLPAPVDDATVPVAAGATATPSHASEPGPLSPSADDEQAELLAVFLDEAREVLQAAQAAVDALRASPAALTDLTTLRRGFHTLKGSSRMVGLTDFGEAAWAMEQLLNAWLADQKPAHAPLCDLATEALALFTRWVDAVAAGQPPGATQAQAVRASADAMRLQGLYQPLTEPSLALQTEPSATPEPLTESHPTWSDEEPVKVIGDLRIGLELYNVYLNEADEWSRRLCHDLSEWALQPAHPLPESASVLAHSLAGSSATVGYTDLSRLARALEHALDRAAQRAAPQRPVSVDSVQLVVAAAEELRRLLHQFAAGFLKDPPPEMLPALEALWTGPDSEPIASAGAPATVAVPAPSVSAVPAVPTVAPQDIDDDIDAVDTLDADLFPVFEEEALELLPRLGGALRQWVARPDNTSARAEVLRNLHTFKGSARLAGALRLGEMAHRMETMAQRAEGTGLDTATQADLTHALDAIEARLDALRRSHREGMAQPDAPSADPTVRHQAPEGPHTADPAPMAAPAVPVSQLAPAAPVVPPPARATVRVRAELLDRLMNQTGEVMVARTRMESEVLNLRGSLKDLATNLERLRGQLRDLELQAETQMQTRLQPSRDAERAFDPLEFDRYTRVQELTRIMAESVNDVATVQRQIQRAVEATEDGLVAQGRQTRELQRDLLRTRMVEFEALTERLYRVVRQAAKETGKQVRLDLAGGGVEMDRSVLDRMTPAFEHLLRNAVVHGIEPPEVRRAAGKPPEGVITVGLAQSGNDVTLTFADDGAGLDLEHLRAKALAMGRTDMAQADAAALTALVFAPGLSTADRVSELAGRGIGLDVVRTDALALGGRVDVRRLPQGGTAFDLVLPLTTAVTQVVMVRVADFHFGVPAHMVERVHRLAADELAPAHASGRFADAAPSVSTNGAPFFWAGALLQTAPQPETATGRTLPVLLLHSAGQRLALQVDEVLGHQEAVVKHLGPQLSRLPGLVGMTVLASGAVGLIYNPVALAAVYGEAARSGVAIANAPPVAMLGDATTSAPLAPLVLVVDDSITVRRVTQRLLQREGYRVALAHDGLQALERLRQERPVVLLSDIEMPRMDGFELVQQLRADAALADLPVVMITSRLADKHREHARELGVDHYLGKPYPEDELLGLVAHYAQAAGFFTTA